VSAAFWGAADFAGGLATRRSSSLQAVFLAQAVGLILTAPLLLLSAETVPPPESLLWASLAGAGASLGLAGFYLALSRGAMGLVAPLTALIAAALPAIVGLISGESVGALVILGMVCALIAVVLISLPEKRLGSPTLATFRGTRFAEWLLILGAGVSFALFYVAVDAAHDAGGEVWWPLFTLKLTAILGISAVALVLVPLGRAAAIRLGRAALLLGALAGLGDFGGNLFFVLASAEGGLAVVAVLASLYPVTTVVLARVVLHERLGRPRLAGVVLAISGVVLIGLGSL